jgi:DNA-directed RNA polymerase specialized sigma24 family protein
MSFENRAASLPTSTPSRRQHKDAVYRHMLRVSGNHEDAEDVLVEAWLEAYRHLDPLRDSAAFRFCLAQIGRRVCWQLKEREALLTILQLSTLEAEGLARRAIAAPPPLYGSARVARYRGSSRR